MRRTCLCVGLGLALTGCPDPLPQGDGGPVLGGTCDPSANPDPCQRSGLVCHADPSGIATCGLALFGEPCLPSIGCAVGDGGNLECNAFSDGDGGAQAVDRCGPRCASSADCLDASTDCLALALLPGGACAPNGCSTPLALCPSGGSNVGGTCVPSGPREVCIQSGPAALGAPCTNTRADGGTTLCEPGDGCILSGQPGLSLCEPLCRIGRACPGGTSCALPLGLCLAPCSPGVATGCPSPLHCATITASTGDDAGSFCQLPSP